MSNEKAKQASSGLKKLTDAQKEAIKALYDAKDKRFTEVWIIQDYWWYKVRTKTKSKWKSRIIKLNFI